MKKLFLAATMLGALVGYNGAASAATIDPLDPLHGTVCGAGGTGCVNTDNGSFAPLGSVSNWGFDISPGPATGDLTLAFLVPTNLINVNTFDLNADQLRDNGGALLTLAVISRSNLLTSANGASLATYLQLANAGNFSPTDNFSNASAGEATLNPGFTGSFLAFTVTIPNITLDDQSSTTITNDFSFGSNLPAGTVIGGFFVEATDHKGDPCTNNCYIGTAASGDLVVTPFASVPGPIVGAGLPGIVAACGSLIGLGWRRRRRSLGLA